MKFTLRQKIFVVFAMLLLIAALISLQSIRRFNQLGRSIDVILKENYRSVIACQQMNDALERMDSGLLFILSGFVYYCGSVDWRGDPNCLLLSQITIPEGK